MQKARRRRRAVRNEPKAKWSAATTYKESTTETNVRFLPRGAWKQNPAKNETAGFNFFAGECATRHRRVKTVSLK